MQQTISRPSVRSWMRPIYFALGIVSLAIGIVGIALPLVPTTGPVILAAFFFTRSSDRFHDWLLTHPRFGPLIADFRAGKGIPLGTKVWALIAMVLAFGFAVVFVAPGWLAKGVILAIAAWAIGYVARLPVRR
jgi:uncharacterized membrane protein YbaN (DUF454 family)